VVSIRDGERALSGGRGPVPAWFMMATPFLFATVGPCLALASAGHAAPAS
jgi:hypothetical protein